MSYDNLMNALRTGEKINFISYLPNCIHVSEKNIDSIKMTHYISHKADGERCLYLVCKGETYLITMNNRILLHYTKCPDMLLDGELMDGYLIFDILFLHEVILPKLLVERLAILQNIINKFNLSISVRPIYPISEFNINIKPTYKSDGIIFIPQEGGNVIKWKPRELLTIDFYLKDIGKGNRYLLCINGKKSIIPFQYKGKFYHTKDDRLKPGMIVECVYKNETFQPLRIRKDKFKSNSMRTVRDLIEIMENFIPLDAILSSIHEQ